MRSWREVASRLEASGRWLWFATFLPLLFLYSCTLRVDVEHMSADPVAVSPSSWAVATYGRPVLAHALWPPWNPWLIDVGHGLVVSNRTPGLVYLGTPGYWLSGIGPLNVFPASVTAAVVTAAAMASLALLLRHFVRARVAFTAALLAGTATTTWAVSGTSLYPHGPDQLLLIAAMLGLATHRYARSGLAFALTMLVRPSLGLVATVSGLAESWHRRSLRPAIVIGTLTAAGAVGYWAYAAHYWHIASTAGADANSALAQQATHGYGRQLTAIGPGVWPGYAEKIVGAFVSPGRGLFTGSPFLLALLPGLRRAWRIAPQWARWCVIGATGYLLVQLKAQVFTGGSFFWSYRYPLEPLTLCAPLLVLAWREWTSQTARRRAAFGGLAIFSVAWQAIGAACFRGPFPDRPWTFANLTSALTGQHATLAWALFLGGSASGCGYYLARRGSGRTDVLDVAGADRLLAV